MPQPFNLCQDLGELHAYERLNYVLGQVLGVKDFQQEQAYFLHKARLHNRSLHGYGTVWGLDVTTNDIDTGLEIQVSPGLAIDTQGREVLVDALQCANLTTWLTAAVAEGSSDTNLGELQKIAAKAAAPSLAVYVTLCYRPCPRGAQPILGNPCRTDSGEEGVIQYTRIRDEFELKLLSAPPRQIEEDQVRAIGDLFAKIEIDASPTANLDPTLVPTLKDCIDDPARIPLTTSLTIPAGQARDILRELLRYWVTNTRPTLDKLQDPVLKLLEKIRIDKTITTVPAEEVINNQITLFTERLDEYVRTKQLPIIDAVTAVTVPGNVATRYRRAILQHWSSKLESSQSPEDGCILLASVTFTMKTGDTKAVDESTLNVVNLQRPYLLHTRLLQELLLQGILQGPGGTGPQGNPGTPATITIGNVTTGDPGTPASVTNSGDSSNARLDFIIPKGEAGTGGTGTPTPIRVGNVTTGAPGTNASVNNSGTPSEAILDFVIPRGDSGLGVPGEAAQIAIGSVTPGAPGTNPVVTNTGTSNNAIFNFEIPQGLPGSPGRGFDQIILRPTDMVLPLNQEPLPNDLPGGIGATPFATPGTLNGHPAIVFNPAKQQLVAAFSTLRPTSLDPRKPLFLQLYCTARKGFVEWQVTWRWLRALNPGETANSLDTDLIPTDNFASNGLPRMDLNSFHLHRSEPLELKLTVDNPDYLVVYLFPKMELGGDGVIDQQLYLLMSELKWEV